jgi:hypothetical protein
MGEPAKAGPCVTDNGNFLIDVDFGVIADPVSLHRDLKLLAGVVETGLFINMAEKGALSPSPSRARGSEELTSACNSMIVGGAAYFGLEDGTVSTIAKPNGQ